MNLLTCATAAVPCPLDQQQAITELNAQALMALGLTPEAILAAYVFGAGSVVTWWFLGYVIAVATRAMSKA